MSEPGKSKRKRLRNADGTIPVWCWRDAIFESDAAPLTRLVCLAIARYLADCGKGCFPNVETLQDDTGLSNKSITTHLKLAEAAGLLVVNRRKGPDGRNLGHVYLPKFPDKAVLARQPAQDIDADESHMYGVHVDSEPDVPGSCGPHVNEGENPHVPRTPVNTPTGEISKEETPKSPEGRGLQDDLEIESEISEDEPKSSPSKLLADLIADGRHHNVVENLLAPILTQRRFSAADAIGELRTLRHAAKDLPKPALDKAVAIVLAGPKTVKPDRIRQALKAATMVARADAADAIPVDADTERVRAGLRKRLGDDVYRSWFAGMTVQNDNGRLLLVVPTRMHSNWVQANYTMHVEAVAGASARVVAKESLR